MASSAASIRQRLCDSREDFAQALGLSLERLEAIEAGAQMPQALVLRIAQYAKDRGLVLTVDQIYGSKPLP